ncbi:pentatricopeptide repeat-containing protein At3g12770-like [Magnolia sinica]|uniref:pentatricopeptide repeat-containing protein At3g12770-like n=1 Tax=Magnolia sinica TaxID=86752 RepID=UPI00265861B5|nr:pentatricopeptide repeat-containing protein At3g12770-like [Magnolia sinica]
MTLLLLPFIKRHGSYYPNPRQPLISFHTQQPKSHPNISTIKTLVQGGHFIQALQHYTNLWNNGHKPDNFTFPYILKASSQLPHPTIGLSIHSHAIKTGFHTDLFVGNSLILFYARFGYLDIMHRLFDEIPQKNIVTWTAIISAYSQNGQFSYAIELFHGMLVADVRPNSFTMAVILGGLCCNQGAMQIHGFMIKCGFESDVIISTALIDSYAKCGNAKFACGCFSEMTQRNLVSWNAMISGFNRSGNTQAAL